MQVQVGRGNYMAHYNFDLTKKSHRPKSFSKLELSDGNTYKPFINLEKSFQNNKHH